MYIGIKIYKKMNIVEENGDNAQVAHRTEVSRIIF
uniref:Uncharacterized protein n=1 Tax=viral metagenome TaxID=1070528 RepID=A0A6C0EUN9_9ZZZZ